MKFSFSISAALMAIAILPLLAPANAAPNGGYGMTKPGGWAGMGPGIDAGARYARVRWRPPMPNYAYPPMKSACLTGDRGSA